ncbi:MAG: M20 family metallopeptidase [Bacteroidales bacterium]|nr:M20 family metallopeptidase [Bacteroidales bacterium]
MDKIAKIITQRADEIFDETVRLRRHFHMYPELSFKEAKTADFICSFLDANKIDYIKDLAGTGIIAWVNGQGGTGRVVVLRAEMDALPIHESTTLEYASKNRGIMHACGHDAHMAMLLSSIKIIKAVSSEFGGRIGFIFQPGEEVAPGGAKLLMKTQAFRDLKPDLIIAQHVLPELETGMTGFRPGKYMASSDELHISIHGRGGHAALPGQSTDQVGIGSELVMRLKDTVNDYPENELPVIGIGHFSAEGTTNIIPEEIQIKGTLRTFDEKVREDLKKRVRAVCTYIQNTYGVEVNLEIPDGYPVLLNNHDYVKRSVELAGIINGEEMVKEVDRRMSSEDFAFYSQKYPAVFFRLGVKSITEGMKGLHTPGFTIDEKAMLTGMRTLSYLGLKFTAC